MLTPYDMVTVVRLLVFEDAHRRVVFHDTRFPLPGRQAHLVGQFIQPLPGLCTGLVSVQINSGRRLQVERGATADPMEGFGRNSSAKFARKKPERSEAMRDSVWSKRHVIVATAILLAVGLYGSMTATPIRSIFPYAFAAGLVAWKHGVAAGFLFAGFGTLSALATGAFPSNEELRGHELGEGLYTYLKLSAVVLGVALGNRSRRK